MKNTHTRIRWMFIVALFMAFTLVLSTFSIPVPGGHFYLNDIVIVIAAVLLDPLGAFLACGVGSFLGDVFFYPAPMFVTLVTHGLQAIVISLAVRKIEGKKGLAIGLLIGQIIMITGYTLGRSYVYATPEYAMLKLPFDFAQAIMGAVVGLIVLRKAQLQKKYDILMA